MPAAKKKLETAAIASRLAFNFIDTKPDVDPNQPGLILPRDEIKGQYIFHKVCFAYPSNPQIPILKNFSCIFEAGKTTAFVGPSGSGKSTITQLVERFYNPSSGTIKLDGTPID